MHEFIGFGVVFIVFGPNSSLFGNLGNSLEDEPYFLVAQDRVDGKTDETGFGGVVASIEAIGNFSRNFFVNAEKVMTVGAGAGAAAASLDAIMVI